MSEIQVTGLGPDLDLNDMTKDERIRSLSLMLAIKYHGETVVKDGTLYQQYKLEGRNMRTLDDEMIIETAVRYETFIRCGENPERMALIEDIADNIDKAIESGAVNDEAQS